QAAQSPYARSPTRPPLDEPIRYAPAGAGRFHLFFNSCRGNRPHPRKQSSRAGQHLATSILDKPPSLRQSTLRCKVRWPRPGSEVPMDSRAGLFSAVAMAIALFAGLAIAAIDYAEPFGDDSGQFTVFLWLLASGLLGFAVPAGPWRWAALIGPA